MKRTKKYISSASKSKPHLLTEIVSRFIKDYHGGTAWSSGELRDGRTFQVLEYLDPIALDEDTIADMKNALEEDGYDVLNITTKGGEFYSIRVAPHVDDDDSSGEDFDADDAQWILEQLFDNGCIDEIKPLVDMAHLDDDEIDFELENIKDIGNGWVQFTLSGYHGQDAFEVEIQLNLDNPATYVML